MSISLSDPVSVGLSAARLERIAPAMQTFVDKRGFRHQHDARAPRSRITPKKSARVAKARSGLRRFQTDTVVNRIPEPLLAAESFCSLDAHVTEQKLDLLQLAAGLMAQSSTGSTKIVRGDGFKST